MKKQTSLCLFAFLAVFACLTGTAVGQSPGAGESIASIVSGRSEIKWQPHVEHARLILTVSAPGGDVYRREFESGTVPTFSLLDKSGQALPDGSYAFELLVVPTLAPGVREALAASREKGNGDEVEREFKKSGLLPQHPIVQSGSFLMEKGALVLAGQVEREDAQHLEGEAPDGADPERRKKKKKGEEGTIRPFDQVIPDDLIVQSSLCVGFDCVNNENFGFDTIRLKENNLRIKFEDTSIGAFPSNDWQLTANDSASGGANKFSIEDVTGARVPFTITAGAATNSLFLDSIGRVGLRTSTPVVDVHAITTNTPAIRLDQSSAGGFSPQIWDVAGNEANFFVRDVTTGSRLPFRIRPGAPTSSLDIRETGNVGIGTDAATEELHVLKAADENVVALVQNTNNTVNAATIIRAQSNTAIANFITHADAQTISRFGQTLGGWAEVLQTSGVGLAIGTLNANPLVIGTNSASRIFLASTGNIGLGGQNAPTSPLHHANGATLSAGGMWTNASSRALKMNISSLSGSDALAALKQMNPVTFQYKLNPTEKHVGFIAEDVPDLVATSDRKGLSAMDVVAVLTRVVQEQHETIAQLKERLDRLEKSRVRKARFQTRR